ncbi:hypothetical protein BSKO_06569 [Bryopsis sp. KO-2023]|nr:hypothetical protein BSKO_06569 [Bryopsis sp. KO-2023]
MTTRGAKSRHGLVIEAGKKGKAQNVAKSKASGDADVRAIKKSRRLVFLREKFDLPAKQDAASVIQRHYRRHLARALRKRMLQDQTKAAVAIQATIRGFLARSALNHASECAKLVQSAWRGYQARKKTRAGKNETFRCKSGPPENKCAPTTPQTSVPEGGSSVSRVDSDASMEADLAPTDSAPTQDPDAQLSDSIGTWSTKRASHESQSQDTEKTVATSESIGLLEQPAWDHNDAVITTVISETAVSVCDESSHTAGVELIEACKLNSDGNANEDWEADTTKCEPESVSSGTIQDLTADEVEQGASLASDGVATDIATELEVCSIEKSVDGGERRAEEPQVDEECTGQGHVYVPDASSNEDEDAVFEEYIEGERNDSNPVRTYGISYTVVTSTTLPAKESTSDDESGVSSVDAVREARIEAATRAQAAMAFKGPGMDGASNVDVCENDPTSTSTEFPLPKYMSPRMQKRQMRQMQTQEHFVAARQDEPHRTSISPVGQPLSVSRKSTEKPRVTLNEEQQAHFSVESGASPTNEGALMQPSRIRR